jgi:hypothetical protein
VPWSEQSIMSQRHEFVMLFDLGRRIPARDRFAPDSLLEGARFEISVPRVRG